ncbi:hypothetical protein Scep_007826 [Stephania cephalantha]|uniref:PB1-like domain-containing protein n=1 Tax=Stephania cephalantha TaxID=152367 RepID=A0AAP0KCB7_9MAGN
MAENLRFFISYGGQFRGDQYINGKRKLISSHFDVDLLSYPNVMSYVKDLGYTTISALYYFNCGKKDFVIVKDDVDVLNACEGKKNGDLLEFFIEHVRDINVSGGVQNQHFLLEP